MKVRQWITALCCCCWWLRPSWEWCGRGQLPAANEEAAATPGKKVPGRTAQPVAQHPLVDQRPLQTARRMAATRRARRKSKALAHQAEKVGDHEVDLAFFDALRTARRKSSAAFAGSPSK